MFKAVLNILLLIIGIYPDGQVLLSRRTSYVFCYLVLYSKNVLTF